MGEPPECNQAQTQQRALHCVRYTVGLLTCSLLAVVTVRKNIIAWVDVLRHLYLIYLLHQCMCIA